MSRRSIEQVEEREDSGEQDSARPAKRPRHTGGRFSKWRTAQSGASSVQTANKRVSSLTPASTSASPHVSSSAAAVPHISGTDHQQSTSQPPKPPTFNNEANASEVEPSESERLMFEFDISPVFEARFTYQGLHEAYYCMWCGPFLIRRRRRDGFFIISPLLRLLKLSFGDTNYDGAAEMLEDIVDEDTLEAELLQKPSCNRPAPLSLVRKMAEQVGLASTLSSILDASLPELPESDPLTLKAPPRWLCRYCDVLFDTWRLLQKHHLSSFGACQLENGRRLAPYLELLNQIISSNEDCSHQSGDAPGLTADLDNEFARLPESIRDVRENPLSPSSIPPTLTYWTTMEKERFFFALPRYSRWRPDLIAEHIGTKNMLEVAVYLNLLQEEASSLPAKLDDISAAREMSERWVTFEESLAEDCVVWEAFTEQASRTPLQMRDAAQRMATAEETISCLSRACEKGQCDGVWPTCGRCAKLQRVCEWQADFHPEALPLAASDLKIALAPLFRKGDDRDHFTAIQDEFLHTLNWHQLYALHPNEEALELKWESAEHARNSKKMKSRAGVAFALRELGLPEISITRKEAIYTEYKKVLGETVTSGYAKDAIMNIIRPLLESDRVAETEARLNQREESIRKRKMKPVKPKMASLWSQIPLSRVLAFRYPPELAGLQEEAQQAKKQLSAVGIRLEALGDAGQLFHLKKLAVLLDVYRTGTDDTAQISQAAIALLYDLVKEHVTQVLVNAAAISDIRDMKSTPKDATTIGKAVVLTAIKSVEKNRQTSTATSKHFLQSLETRLQAGAPLQPIESSVADAPPIQQHFYQQDWPHEVDIYQDDDIVGGSTSNSQDETDSDEDGSESECAAEDARLEEADRLQDHLHEEELWAMFEPDAEAEKDEDEIIPGEETDVEMMLDEEEEQDANEREGTGAGSELSDDELGLSESEAEGLDRRPNLRDRSQTSGLASTEGRASTGVDDEDDENDSEDDAAGDDAVSVRPSPVLPRRSRQGLYRTKDHISTSDEEDL